jgi:hypothetical protein
MSETETGPQPGGEAPEAAVTETEATAPVDAGAATETEAETDEKREDRRRAQLSAREEKRIAQLSARMAALAARNDELERRIQQPPPPRPVELPQTPEEFERLVEQRAEQKADEKAARARAVAFHQQGIAEHGKDAWAVRCNNLQAMGADAGMAQLLIEMPNGPRVAASLADDPEELERIAAISTATGRAIALGQYAATLAAPARRTAPVSRAPAPIRPVTGVANPVFNEYTASAEELMDYYSKQAMERRRA